MFPVYNIPGSVLVIAALLYGRVVNACIPVMYPEFSIILVLPFFDPARHCKRVTTRVLDGSNKRVYPQQQLVEYMQWSRPHGKVTCNTKRNASQCSTGTTVGAAPGIGTPPMICT